MIDRRRFLRLAGGAAVTAAAGDLVACSRRAVVTSTSASAAGTIRFPVGSVGVQLYTVRSAMQQNVERTLEQVAAAGYRLVETAGTYDRSPADFRALLDRYGLRSTSGHYGYDLMDKDPDAVIGTARTLGQEYLIVPSLPASVHATRDAWGTVADRFNQFGERCKAAGLQFGYHNHSFEFETLGGPDPVYDILLERTDPKLVAFELDLFWIHMAGQDPMRYIERYPGRFQLFHVKDAKAGAGDARARMTEVGQGEIPFNRLFAAAERAGLRYAFVEHDFPADPIQSIRASHDYLATLLPRG